MRIRFRVSDVMWLVLVLALGLGWWLDRNRLASAHLASEKAVESMSPNIERDYVILGRLTEEDIEALEPMVRELTTEPVLRIKRSRLGDVEVTTGHVRGPLDGGGSSFIFEKRDGKWELTAEGGWVS